MGRILKIVGWVAPWLIVLTIGAFGFCPDELGDFFNKYGAAITVLATLVIAIFTIVLALCTTWQARLTREAMLVDKRAFVFAVGLDPLHEPDEGTGLYNWRFRPLLRNSGDTPTKNMTFHTGYALRDTPLPPEFNFDYATDKIGKGMLPPKFNISGSQAPDLPNLAITPLDLSEIQAGRKYLYFWGWVRYHDVFPDTPQHITRFCWLIVCGGNPIAFEPDGPDLTFGIVHHEEGNCADEECAHKGCNESFH